jgi:nicotinate-nucleotide--dimethylbenzimidazole phosphoribosyltransferase
MFVGEACRATVRERRHLACRDTGVALEALDLSPLLDLEMRLGEGTGAVLAMAVAGAACAMMSEMATFDEAGVSGPVA